MLLKILIFSLCTVVLARNVPMDENEAKGEVIQIINDHCKLIQMDKKSINQLMQFFHMEEVENITACDLACDAYGTNITALADIVLNSDGDLHYAINRINTLFNAKLLRLENDVITVDVDGFNEISGKTVNHTVEQLGKKNKVAAYMLKNLIDVQNRTNFPLVREHLEQIKLPADQIILIFLPIIDKYHKYLRDHVSRDEIDYEDEKYHFDDEFVEFEEKQAQIEAEAKAKAEADAQAAEIAKQQEEERRKEQEVADETDATTEGRHRLIDQFIENEDPIAKLKREMAAEYKQREEALLKQFGRDAQSETTKANKEGRARELTHNNHEIKGLYDADDLDYAGIRNVGRVRLENERARKANDDDDEDYVINTRDMPMSSEEDDQGDQDDEQVGSRDFNNAPEPDADDDDDDQVYSRDFIVPDDERGVKGKKKADGLMGFFMGMINSIFGNLIKGFFSNGVGMARMGIHRMLDKVKEIALMFVRDTNTTMGRIFSYTPNFIALWCVDNVNNAKRAVDNFFEPLLDKMAPPADDDSYNTDDDRPWSLGGWFKDIFQPFLPKPKPTSNKGGFFSLFFPGILSMFT